MLTAFNAWFSRWEWSLALILSLVAFAVAIAVLALVLTTKGNGGGGGRWHKRPTRPKPGKGIRVGVSRDFYQFMQWQKRNEPWYKQAMDGWRHLRPNG